MIRTRSGCHTDRGCKGGASRVFAYSLASQLGYFRPRPNAQVDPATNSACHKLAAVKLPASWQPTLRRLAAVRTCLKRAGVVAVGGSVPPAFQGYSDTPIGTLMMAGPTRPTSIAFYASDARASQAYARVRDNVAKEGGTMIRHGQLLIVWGSLPTPGVHASEERCGLHS